MIEELRRRFAVRALAAALAARTPLDLAPHPGHRTLLVVLPDDELGQRATWSLLDHVDLGARQIHPVVMGERVAYQPDRFAGAVRTIGDGERDWRRLPTAAARQSVWTTRPDVALNLAGPSDLASAMLVGGSPAAVRIGRHAPGREDCYDLMVQGEPDAASAADALGRLLRQITPPILPLPTC